MIKTNLLRVKNANAIQLDDRFIYKLDNEKGDFVLIPVLLEKFIPQKDGSYLNRFRQICELLCFDLTDQEVQEKMFVEVKEHYES